MLGVVLAVIIVLALVMYMCDRKRNKKEAEKEGYASSDGGALIQLRSSGPTYYSGSKFGDIVNPGRISYYRNYTDDLVYPPTTMEKEVMPWEKQFYPITYYPRDFYLY